MLRLYFKLRPKCRPTDSLLPQYDYDIIICPQGVVGGGGGGGFPYDLIIFNVNVFVNNFATCIC